MEPGQFYHYFNRANNFENLFLEEENYRFFLQLMRKYIPPVADVYSYCLMPNHFHLVFRTKDFDDLPQLIKSGKRKITQPFSNFFNAYAKAFNKKHNRRGSLFQTHPRKILIDNNAYLREAILYVNCNAAHHNFCEAEDYPHSSYHALLDDGKTALVREKVHALFEGREALKEALENKDYRIALVRVQMLEDED